MVSTLFSLSATHITVHLQQKQINLSFRWAESCIKWIDAKEYCAKLIQHESFAGFWMSSFINPSSM